MLQNFGTAWRDCGWVAAVFCLLASGCAQPKGGKQPRPAELADFLQKSRQTGAQKVMWQPVLSLTFDDPRALAAWPVVEGEWVVKGGQLRAVSGKRNRAILLAPAGFDPVRIEFEATLTAGADGKIGDITVLLNSALGQGFFRSGYALTTASYYNQCTTFYRLGRPLARTEYSPARPGVKNRVILEFVAGHIRYWLNGEIILEAWDPEPLKLESKRWLGIRTWNTDLAIDNLTISRGRVVE